MRAKWTHAKVNAAIRSMPIPSPTAAKKIVGLYASGIRLYGSWRNAVEASGFVYSGVGARRPAGFWTQERVAQSIGNLSNFHSAHARREHPALYSAAMRCFGSWKSAVESAGIDYDSIQKPRPIKAS